MISYNRIVLISYFSDRLRNERVWQGARERERKRRSYTNACVPCFRSLRSQFVALSPKIAAPFRANIEYLDFVDKGEPTAISVNSRLLSIFQWHRKELIYVLLLGVYRSSSAIAEQFFAMWMYVLFQGLHATVKPNEVQIVTSWTFKSR